MPFSCLLSHLQALQVVHHYVPAACVHLIKYWLLLLKVVKDRACDIILP